MELVTHYSRSFRRAYERSISDQKYENHHYTEDIFKGHNQNCSEFNSYHSHSLVNSSLNDLRAKDLTVDKVSSLSQQLKMNGVGSRSAEISGGAAGGGGGGGEVSRIKQEEPMVKEKRQQMISIRRYFCIFCKMDFTYAEEFLDHLELHPNGSFVLVKRDEIATSPQLSPKEPQQQHQHHHQNDNNNTIPNNNVNNHISGKNISNTNNNNNNNNNLSDNDENKKCISSYSTNERQRFEATEDETSNLPIIPEMLKNQIKIEPISEDEEDDAMDAAVDATTTVADNHISMNEEEDVRHHQPHRLSPQTRFSENAEMNHQTPSPDAQNNNHNIISNGESGDPNHQLLVLSNPRIGDGPGEYLCNVCHAKFVYKNNLKSHLKRHLGIYPYVCFCGKRYQFKCKLNKHIEQAHAKIKNFKCPVPTCPKKYFTRNDLAFHISVTHQERQEIPCNICQKVFNSQKSLQIHCRKYHRNQES